MKRYYVFVLLSVATGLKAQRTKPYSPEVEARIRKVENNLGGWVKIQDSTGWNIVNRMAYYHINGVGIAIINNYKVEWVKGYGWADTAKKILVTPETMFQAASIGKSINAVGMMKLVHCCPGKMRKLKKPLLEACLGILCFKTDFQAL